MRHFFAARPVAALSRSVAALPRLTILVALSRALLRAAPDPLPAMHRCSLGGRRLWIRRHTFPPQIFRRSNSVQSRRSNIPRRVLGASCTSHKERHVQKYSLAYGSKGGSFHKQAWYLFYSRNPPKSRIWVTPFIVLHPGHRPLCGKRGKNVGDPAFFPCSGSTRCDSLRMCRR
jgi:hypothetical protein